MNSQGSRWTLDHTTLLFVGSKKRGARLKRLAGEHKSALWAASETMEALSIYITFMPDVVILEDDDSFGCADEVAFHLKSVGARPLLILARPSRLGLWREVISATSLVLPEPQDDEALFKAASCLAKAIASDFKAQRVVEADQHHTPPACLEALQKKYNPGY